MASIVDFEVKTVPVLVIGSGISGLFTALKLAEAGIRVLIVTKNALSENNSRYAQGGIAAVLPGNEEDSLALHVEDTLEAGAGLCDESIVRSILGDGFEAISDLLLMGVPFDKNELGELELTLEGGHSVRRIIHAGGDATGKQVEMTLIRRVNESPLIECLEYCEVAELLSAGRECYGCRAVAYKNEQPLMILSQYTVLATGGVGRLYSRSTNPAGATGNGFALAYMADANLRDMEFVQFHPTAFFKDGKARFLISEALRGEGGVLRNAEGEPFTQQYDPRGDLAPRDIVTRAIYAELKRQQASGNPADHVFLDITHLSVETIEKRFPTILKACLDFGTDIRKEWIPVAPAAHYIMGGVEVDLNGRTTVENLFVVGETVWTGLHGANRLASNSLLECVVLARSVAADIAADYEYEFCPVPPEPLDLSDHGYRFETPDILNERLEELHRVMWDGVGIIRSESTIREALDAIEKLEDEAVRKNFACYAPLGIDYANQLVVARLIAEAALSRRESRGAHYREDCPDTGSAAKHSFQTQHEVQQEPVYAR